MSLKLVLAFDQERRFNRTSAAREELTMEMEATIREDQLARVRISGDLLSQIGPLGSTFDRRVLRRAAILALERSSPSEIVRIRRTDLLDAIRTEVPKVVAEFERSLNADDVAYARQAS
jgi:hypothetical protein